MGDPGASIMPFVSDGTHSLRGYGNQLREPSAAYFGDGPARSTCHPAFLAPGRQASLESDSEEGFVIPLPAKSTGYSSLTTWWYRIVSGLLSTIFLIFYVLLGALIKAIPSGLWVLWSWCTFRNPDRYRPFYVAEKERRRMKTHRMKADISYYAGHVGLDCEEMKVETEDGFILTMQRIVDRRPEGINSRRTPSVK
jgi:hypothetical protein